MVDDSTIWQAIAELASSIDTSGSRSGAVELTPRTDLVKDLGLTGDDAFRFMDTFAERLKVAPGDFDALDYFEEESLWLLPWFGRKTKGLPITLGMLFLAAKDGRWDSAKLNRANLDDSYCDAT